VVRTVLRARYEPPIITNPGLPFPTGYELRFRGTLAPFSRASLNPIAIACLRLVTFRPPRVFSVPFLRRRMVLSTRFLAVDFFAAVFRPVDFRPVDLRADVLRADVFLPVLRPEDFRADDLRPVLDFRAAMRTSPERLFTRIALIRRKNAGALVRARMIRYGTQNTRPQSWKWCACGVRTRLSVAVIAERRTARPLR